MRVENTLQALVSEQYSRKILSGNEKPYAVIAHVRFCVGIWGVIPISTKAFIDRNIGRTVTVLSLLFLW